MYTTSIHPSTTILPWSYIVEVAYNIITQVILQVLCRTRVARLRACPDAIKIGRLFLKIEAKAVEMIVPIGIFHNDLYLGVHLLSGVYHQFTPRISHQAEPILRPALTTPFLRRNLIIVLQVDEKEIVKDEVIKESGGVLSHLSHHLPLVASGVAVGFKVGRLGAGIGDATSHLKTF